MPETKPKNVAAIVTEYRRHSHADVIVGKILEGLNYQGKTHPRMKIASMFVDQFPDTDMSRDLAKRYKFPIYKTIEQAITLGRNGVNVDGVLCIAEHGNYPKNKLGQQLYPRRRFFEAVTRVFERHKKVVPVFNDKHLSATWEDAKWMYDRARKLHIPFMAGSSLPVTWRRPPLSPEKNTPFVEAVQVGYGGLESYGFHALESLQCLVERRRGGETGVRSVQFLNGDEMWKAIDRRIWSQKLLDDALELVPAHAKGDYRKLTTRNSSRAGVFLIDYRDGFKAAMAMMNGYVYEGDGGAFCFAGRVRGKDKPLATHFYLQNIDPFGHFGWLVKAIDQFMQTGHAVYPVERTLLTTGILNAAMNSRAAKNRRIATPYLNISYQPTNWGFAKEPVPKPVKR